MQYTEAATPASPPLHHGGGRSSLSLDLPTKLNGPLLHRGRHGRASPPPPPSPSVPSIPPPAWSSSSSTAPSPSTPTMPPSPSRSSGSSTTSPPRRRPHPAPHLRHPPRLTSRASRSGAFSSLAAVAGAGDSGGAAHSHRFSPLSLAAFLDLTPWHRFGYSAANAAILDAVEGLPVVHIVDLSTTHCMQMPTLIDALAGRPEGPPFLKLTVADWAAAPPPIVDVPCEELGRKLVNFARSRHVVMEFKAVPCEPSDGFATLIDHLRVQQQLVLCDGEALVVNCQMKLHYIPETAESPARRAEFLKAVRGLNPAAVTLVEEDVDLSSGDMVARLRTAFNYLWVHYDAAEAVLPRGSDQRWWYEGEVMWKIENLLACEGLQRVERPEERSRWMKRMKAVGFQGVPFGEEAVAEVKSMLDEHAAGWG
ncbi:unnamed protein product [Spirodela intermedia]|uniref:Uncharacterized protein n=1 Tax=Spirodela intermedia TaxID=51605 RepID=A0A7I8IYL7_SPIIN|nr:unnamed protein product [Spirodela intermedia]CAA6662977.1 unnamed protein product [Spirodela intermedia]